MTKMRSVKDEYNELLDSFEKSEAIRREQKEVISTLRAEVNRLKRKVNERAAERRALLDEDEKGRRAPTERGRQLKKPASGGSVKRKKKGKEEAKK